MYANPSAKFTNCASAHRESGSSDLNLKRAMRTNTAAKSQSAHVIPGRTGVVASHKKAVKPITRAACHPLSISAGPIINTLGKISDAYGDISELTVAKI